MDVKEKLAAYKQALELKGLYYDTTILRQCPPEPAYTFLQVVVTELEAGNADNWIFELGDEAFSMLRFACEYQHTNFGKIMAFKKHLARLNLNENSSSQQVLDKVIKNFIPPGR